MGVADGSYFRWIFALLIVLLLMPLLAYGQLMIHGDGGGGTGCLINSGLFPVGFAAYRVENEKGNTATKAETVALPKAFCEHLPQTGTFSFTVDLYDPALRAIPVSLRMVRESGDRAEELQSWPAQTYPSGSVVVSVKLDRPGRYALLLHAGKAPLSAPDVRIPLSVANETPRSYWFMVVAGIVLIGASVYWWKRKKGT
jgi:hypothetical protein